MVQPLTADEFADKANVSRETLHKFQKYVELLQKWQKAINLVGGDTLDDIWRRHILDSVQIADYVPSETRIFTDLGSGAGFPGMALSILLGIEVNLVESSGKKIAFLREVARTVDAKVVLHQARIENLKLPKSDLVTARALAPLGKLLDYAEPNLAPDGICLFLKGARVDEELTEAQKTRNMTVERFQSVTDPNGVILSIRDIARVG
ncbi:MAG: 16S rRNA (guanine(527)-N(7))-methyltransferase RsmG [Rhodospirillaceae bacterium]|nr:16S rRNA (guanine(527)-N(7))-methyltransferase RsmG [Rhodospirillaceae bacterium]|tara:strand:+ start:28855 stop:29475 length:621 start_codon:yes stop_codon:yes gene_type:complete